MNLIQRTQDILLRPNSTWPQIEQESGDPASIYKDYLIYLAAIPALASFVGLSLIGVGLFGFGMRVPIVSGFVHMVVGYVLSLVMVYLIALIVNALAGSFGARADMPSALKLVAYGSTAGFIGGIFSLIPALSPLGLLASLYSIYLIYAGLPVLMKCPPGKAAAYTAVVTVCGIVAGAVLGLVTGGGMAAGFR